jgi:hypothetical protein
LSIEFKKFNVEPKPRSECVRSLAEGVYEFAGCHQLQCGNFPRVGTWRALVNAAVALLELEITDTELEYLQPMRARFADW